VETPRKFITAKLFTFHYLRGVSTNKTIIYLIAMQTYKELIVVFLGFVLQVNYVKRSSFDFVTHLEFSSLALQI
jgi:hypothetical protein